MTLQDRKMRRIKFRSDQDELKLKAAYLYYVEGRTQEQVANHLGISRIKALRLLAATREDGTVQITINSPAGSLIKLQRELEDHLGLAEAIVVPTSDPNEGSVAAVVGHATGRYVSDLVADGLSIGVGWGATLQVCMRSLAWREISNMTTVSLLGGLTHATADNPSAVAWRFADFYRTELYQITAPVFVPDRELADALWKQNDFKKLHQRARKLDIALLSVGDVSKEASIFRRDILSWADAQSLVAAGAVGDLLCHFVDSTGRVIDHPVNHRVMAINPTDLRAVSKVVISSGGIRKVTAIRAGLLATDARVLITDVAAAEALLDLAPINRPPPPTASLQRI